MTTTDPRMNGHHARVAVERSPRAALSAPARRAARRWILIPIGLIVGQMSIVGAMMYIATSDPSFAVEPDYYEKALAWDATAAQREVNGRLAWQASVQLAAGEQGGSELVVRLTNSEGVALDGAAVKAEIFANTRSRDRAILTLTARGDGTYAAPAVVNRAGLWECRLVVQRGPETFTSSAQLEAVARPEADR